MNPFRAGICISARQYVRYGQGQGPVDNLPLSTLLRKKKFGREFCSLAETFTFAPERANQPGLTDCRPPLEQYRSDIKSPKCLERPRKIDLQEVPETRSGPRVGFVLITYRDLSAWGQG